MKNNENNEMKIQARLSDQIWIQSQEILGGMLDAEPRIYKNPKRESFDQQKKRVLQFGAKWKDFDFTKKHKARRTSSSSDSDSDWVLKR